MKYARNEIVNRFHICRNHQMYCNQSPTCPAVSLKGWLRRNGYGYGQYQGTVTTDADRDTIRRWADQFIARYYNRGLMGVDALEGIPTSVLALLGMANKDAPLNGWGSGYSSKAQSLPLDIEGKA